MCGRRRRIRGLAIACLVVLGVGALFTSRALKDQAGDDRSSIAQTPTVGGDHHHHGAGADMDDGTGHVQAMVDAAGPGEMVIVPAGTHPGTVMVRTPGLELIGETGAVMDGGGQGSVLTIAAPDVEVSNITIRGSTRFPVGSPSGVLVQRRGARTHLHDLRVENSYMGITVQRAPEVLIERVHVIGDGSISGELHAVDAHDGASDGDEVGLRGDGIWVFNSAKTVIRDCTIETVRDGVQVTYGADTVVERTVVAGSRYAIHDMYAASLTLRDNRIQDNLSGIVLMYGGPVLIENNTITGNGSASTGYGVLVKDAGGVMIRDNVVADNRVALHIDDAGRTGDEPAHLERNTLALNQVGVLLYPSADATFSANAFVENTTQVALGGSGHTQAVWAPNGLGNNWSDYTGFDATADGVGDVAYERSGRTAHVIARNPFLQALASGAAFRLLSTVEDRWVVSDPLVLDTAPSTEMLSPSLTALRSDGRVPLWIPGAALVIGCGWLLVGPRLRQRSASDG